MDRGGQRDSGLGECVAWPCPELTRLQPPRATRLLTPVLHNAPTEINRARGANHVGENKATGWCRELCARPIFRWWATKKQCTKFGRTFCDESLWKSSHFPQGRFGTQSADTTRHTCARTTLPRLCSHHVCFETRGRRVPKDCNVAARRRRESWNGTVAQPSRGDHFPLTTPWLQIYTNYALEHPHLCKASSSCYNAMSLSPNALLRAGCGRCGAAEVCSRQHRPQVCSCATLEAEVLICSHPCLPYTGTL